MAFFVIEKGISIPRKGNPMSIAETLRSMRTENRGRLPLLADLLTIHRTRIIKRSEEKTSVNNYILDEKNQPVASKASWEWMRENWHRKIVGKTIFPNGTTVSTVFLGLDHGFDKGAPVLWETMVFGAPEGSAYQEEWQDRYTSYADAVAGHIEVVKALISEHTSWPSPKH